jgi:hypothetical protein
MVKVLETGDFTGVLGLFQTLVSSSQFCYAVLCVALVKVLVNTHGSYEK